MSQISCSDIFVWYSSGCWWPRWTYNIFWQWLGWRSNHKEVNWRIFHFFGTSILCWSSKTQQGIIALSATKFEFLQMALSIRQVLYIQPIFKDIGFPSIENVSVMLGDNLPFCKILHQAQWHSPKVLWCSDYCRKASNQICSNCQKCCWHIYLTSSSTKIQAI